MIEHELEFNFKARYYTLGSIKPDTKGIWFVIHGYGQLAKYFIKKFQILESHKICVVAPEGLSRFYLENFEAGKGRNNDRVGATWMTKENRQADIHNYITFLNKLYQHILAGRKLPTTILGFSQGAATASRWALGPQIDYQQLIIWSGVFPPDMDIASAHAKLKDKEVKFVYGNKDPFLTDARFVEMEEIRKQLKVEVSTSTFDGGHEIDESALLQLLKNGKGE
jgi:predicted esterase